jgi:hypothetical protein
LSVWPRRTTGTSFGGTTVEASAGIMAVVDLADLRTGMDLSHLYLI